MSKAIAELKLESIGKRKNNSKEFNAYSRYQFDQIRQYLEERGLFAEQYSEGEYSINSIARELNQQHKTINKAIAELKLESMGKRKPKRGRVLDTYSQEQFDQIRQYLEDHGRFTEKLSDKDYSVYTMLKELHTDGRKITKAIAELGLKSIGRRNNGGGAPFNVFSREQFEQIRQYLDEKGVSAASEGEYSIKAIARELDTDDKRISRAITKLGLESIGERHSQNAPFNAYSQEQLDQIREYLAKNNRND